MKPLPQPVAEKIGRMLPRLGSDHDGEVIATARAIGRALRNAGFDFNDAAERFAESHEAVPTFATSPRAAGDRWWSTDFDPRPSWEVIRDQCREAVRACRAAEGRLSPWEKTFVGSIGPRLTHGLSLTPKQQTSLLNIAERVSA